jgi:hypothetical protein
LQGVDLSDGNQVFVALYDARGRLLEIKTDLSGEFELPESGDYSMKAFLWDENFVPVTKDALWKFAY